MWLVPRYLGMKSLSLKTVFYVILPLLCLVVTGCGAAKLSVADEQMARGEYYDASRTYRKVYNKLTKREERPQRGVIAYKMGECYRKLNMNARASAAYQNAVRYGYPDSTALLYMAQSLQAEGKYQAAINAYNDYIATSPKDADMAETGIAGCRMGIDIKKNPTRYVVKNAKLFNSRRADFAPMFLDKSADALYFTTTNEKVTGSHKSEITGMKKSDIWVARKNERGEWQRPEAVEGELNSEYDEGIVSFTPDGQTMYLTRARREPNSNTSVEIFTSQRSDAKWSAPVKFEITADTLSAYGHPAVSPTETGFILLPTCRADSAVRISGALISKSAPARLKISASLSTLPATRYSPMSVPTVCSILPATVMPGSAVSISSRLLNVLPEAGAWKTWGRPSIPLPMISASLSGKGKADISVPTVATGRGYDHLYSFVLPDLKITISGMVLDRDEEPVPNAVIRIIGDDGSNQKATGKVDGSFSFPLQRGVRYVMLAGAKGYLNARQEFTSDTAEEDADYNVDFILASITKPNVVDNIFYDFDKATLRPESCVALDSIVQVLHDNPNVTIEMASHTDRWGSEEYNMNLSERRAQSVIDYLIAAGIKPDRLQPQGYGKSRPKVITKKLAREFPQYKEGDVLTEEYILALPEEVDQEIADQINRRTEFQVLSIDYKMY